MVEILHRITEKTHKKTFHLIPLHLSPNLEDQRIVFLTRQSRTNVFLPKHLMRISLLGESKVGFTVKRKKFGYSVTTDRLIDDVTTD